MENVTKVLLEYLHNFKISIGYIGIKTIIIYRFKYEESNYSVKISRKILK